MSKPYATALHRTPRTEFVYSDGRSGSRSRSTTHGGFDNDLHTMNGTLRRVGGSGVDRFTEDELEGY